MCAADSFLENKNAGKAQGRPLKIKTATAYYRIASVSQGSDERLLYHKSFVKQKANKLKAEIVMEFEDLGIPAVAEQQVNLRKMMKYLKDHPVDYVITPDFAMLSKRIPKLDEYMEKIKQTGAKLVSVLGEECMMDTSRLMQAIDESMKIERKK
jgi:hypothetical protein